MKLKLILISLAIFAIAGCDHRQEIAKLTSDASDAIEETNCEKAISDYSEVIRLDPKFAPAYVARGSVFVMVHKYDEAIEDLNKGIQLDSTNYLAYQIRGDAFLRKRQFDKAIKDLTVAVSDRSDDADDLNTRGASYKLRGIIYYEKRDFTNAISDFTEAAKYLPDDFYVYEMRGDCYNRKTDADKSLCDFNKAIELNPEASIALYGRGVIYSYTGEYTNAIHDFEKLIQLKPKAVRAYNMLAWVLAICPQDNIRDGKKAVALASQACDMSGWTNYAYIDTLAAAYAETGNFEQAVKYQKQASSMNGIPEGNRTNVQNRLELYLQHKPYHKRESYQNF
jgi:Flp pilus assembly protein TadD